MFRAILRRLGWREAFGAKAVLGFYTNRQNFLREKSVVKMGGGFRGGFC
jgi:hypothetical protein